MTTEQNSVKEFQKTFQPFRNRYIKKQQNSLFDHLETWQTEDKFLSDYLIKIGLEGVNLVLGYFSVYSPCIVGIDIDWHTGIAWKNGQPNSVLLNIYNQIIERFGYIPSLVFKSPRGMHIFFRLSYPVPFGILETSVREKLGNIRYELKPTPKSGLRMPSYERQLDPKTLNPIPFQISDVKIYHPYELFFDDILPEVNKPVTMEEKRERLKGIKRENKMHMLEKSYIPLYDGLTNEAYCSISAGYFFAGLSFEDSVNRFQNIVLFRSPGYRGGLRNENELRRRLKSTYRNLAKGGFEYTGSDKSQSIELDMFDALLVEKLIDAHPFAKQRTKPIQRFLEGLCRWFSWHDSIYKNKDELSRWDYFYTFYRENRKQGYYPLPRSFMVKLDHRYYELVKWLKDVGFLIKAPFEYSAEAHICRYYKIDRALVVESNKEKMAEILALLKESKITPEKLAEGVGVKRRIVFYWLAGRHSIPRKRWPAIREFVENEKKQGSSSHEIILDRLINAISNL